MLATFLGHPLSRPHFSFYIQQHFLSPEYHFLFATYQDFCPTFHDLFLTQQGGVPFEARHAMQN